MDRSACPRGLVALAGALTLAVAGCGDEPSASDTGGIRTSSPQRTFAPLVQTGFGADYRPMSARWFIERSQLATADRGPYAGHRYRDLRDSARGGPPAPPPSMDVTLERAPVYFERHDDEDSRTRISYWALYGMHLPSSGTPREGDWMRVDVILERLGDDRYRRHAAQIDFAPDDPTADGRRTLPWRGLRRHDRTHPIFINNDSDHRLTPADDPRGCGGCVQWRMWTVLRDARAQPWAGFDGPWGEVGATVTTSGPLGPPAGEE